MRRYTRYERESEILINTAGGSFSGRLLDYSPFGIRAKVVPLLKLHEPVEVIAGGIALRGRVSWAGNGITGIEFSGVYRGKLYDYSLSDLLVGLKLSERTGLLEISSNDIKKVILLNKGELVCAQSNIPGERLESLLQRTGRVTREAYARAAARAHLTGKKLGAVLVEQGAITANELFSFMKLSTETVIRNSFRLVDGYFAFREGRLPADKVSMFRLNFPDIIYRGIKKIDSESFLCSIMPDPEAILVPSLERQSFFRDVVLDKTDREILLMIDGQNTLDDILKRSSGTRLETLKAVHAFLSARILQVSPGMEAGASVKGDVPTDNGRDDEFIRRVEVLYRRGHEMENHEILGVGAHAPADEIRRVYHRKVREYHPDRYFMTQDEAFRMKLEVVIDLMNRAYTGLLQHESKRTQKRAHEAGSSTADIAGGKFQEGLHSFKSGNFKNALLLFGQAVYLDSGLPQYHYFHGRTLKIFGKHKEAEQALLKAIKLFPRNADYFAELGYVYFELGMRLRARRAFEKALSTSPDNKQAREGFAALDG